MRITNAFLIRFLIGSILICITLTSKAYIGAPAKTIQLTPRELVTKLDANMNDPARYSGQFMHDPRIGRLAIVGHCDMSGSKHTALYSCPLVGLSPGVLGGVLIISKENKVSSVSVMIESRDDESAGLAAVSFMLAETSIIMTVDRDALHTGIASQSNVTRIINALSPHLGRQEKQQIVHADGFVFTRTLLLGDEVLAIRPDK